MPTLITITVARKLLAGTVAANVLQHGAGGLNIDACRLSTSDNLDGGAYAENAADRADGYGNWRFKRGSKGNAGGYEQPSGRWPANLVLQHKHGCKQVGCVPGCPVAELDEQAGDRPTSTVCIKRQTGVDTGGQTGAAYGQESRPAGTPMIAYGDTGGASRFFKQVGGEED
jgi:site-specific DNA-methyltransferase (adenine-specific)